MRDFSALFQNSLSYKLTPISIRELFFLDTCSFDIYNLDSGRYNIILKRNSVIHNAVLSELIIDGHYQLFIKHDSHAELIEKQQENLRSSIRSLSIGKPYDNAKKVLSLITTNMGQLYKYPTDTQTLDLQCQSIRNLFKFLEAHQDLHAPLYHHYIAQKHHYIYAQPLISSLFLIGILPKTKLFSEKERENLFVTSYFKDIGMSTIPQSKYDLIELSEKDKDLLIRHPEFSIQILKGKIQLPKNYLSIIENHHSFSLIKNNNITESSGDIMISGFETMIISVLDIIAAMITERPYRPSTSLFHSLDLIRILIADGSPQEFKLIVNHFKKFF